MQPSDCIIMTERKDAVDFLATRDKIVEAIDSAYARGLADGRKEAAKSISTLYWTADGVIAQPGDTVWNDEQWANNGSVSTGHNGEVGAAFGSIWHPIERCYSTRAAAEAAKEKP